MRILIFTMVLISHFSLYGQDVVVMKVVKEDAKEDAKDDNCGYRLVNDFSQITATMGIGSLQGTIWENIGESRKPISCCLITIKSVTGMRMQCVSDSAGNYRMPGVLVGRYTITAEKNDLGNREIKNLQISENQITFISFVYEPVKEERPKTKVRGKKN